MDERSKAKVRAALYTIQRPGAAETGVKGEEDERYGMDGGNLGLGLLGSPGWLGITPECASGMTGGVFITKNRSGE
jgi:hypothetical protein